MKTLIYIFFITALFCNCSPKNSSRLNMKDNLAGKSIYQGSADCIIDFDDFDKLTRTRIVGLRPERLFTYTHEKLYDVFIDRPFMEVFGSLSKNNDNKYFLILSFIIDNKYVKSGYKGISTSNLLRINLINGESVFLNNVIEDEGKIDKLSGTITYTGIFPIAKKNLKMLAKYELDRIGVMWNGGFEEYNVFNLDLLKKQYICFRNFNF